MCKNKIKKDNNMAYNAVQEMYREGKNPVKSLDELLEDERQGSELLGNTMFWKYIFFKN